MFICIALLTLAIVGYTSFRHWLKEVIPTARAAQRSLEAAVQHLALKHWEEAKTAALPFLHHPVVGHLAHLRYAEALRGLRRYEEALNCIHYAARRFPEELLLRLEEGKILLELQRPQDALAAFRVCSPILHQDSDFLALADALSRAGHIKTAWELIQERLIHSPNTQLILLGAEILSSLGQLPEAIDLYHKAIEGGEGGHQVLNGLAHAYRRYGNLQLAEQLFRQLLDKDPSDVEATLGLGFCMEERGWHQKALLLYQSGHAWEKKDARLIKQAAFCAMKLKRFADSEKYFASLKDSLHLTATLLSYYGWSLEKQQKWQEAESVYKDTVNRFPSDPNGYRALAWMFGVGVSIMLSKEQGLAYAHIALKLKADPTSWEILSACEARVGNFAKASLILEQLLEKESRIEKRSQLQAALRALRKEHPLDDSLVSRELVA